MSVWFLHGHLNLNRAFQARWVAWEEQCEPWVVAVVPWVVAVECPTAHHITPRLWATNISGC